VAKKKKKLLGVKLSRLVAHATTKFCRFKNNRFQNIFDFPASLGIYMKSGPSVWALVNGIHKSSRLSAVSLEFIALRQQCPETLYH
jgi:hypothetical protein